MCVIPIQARRLLRWHLHRIMQCLSGRRYHVQDIVLRCIWRDVQAMEVKVCHLHAGMTETVLFRLSGKIILIFHVQSAARLHPNHRWRVVASKAKFGFAGDWIRCCFQCHRRACLWQFRKYSVLRTCCRDEQPDACRPAKCAYPELWQNLHRESYRLVTGIATVQAWDFVVPPLR